MEENWAAAAERLASSLMKQWGEELRRGLAEELQPALEAELRGAGEAATLALASGLIRLLQAPNQMEILNVLLQVTQPFAPRAGLLVLRGGAFVGWQSRGIRDAAAFTRLSIPAGERVMARLAQDRQPVKLQAGELGPAFAVGAPAGSGELHLLPLLIRDRLAGVLCADAAGTPAHLEALQALTLTACLAVEAASLRKPAAPVQPAPEAPAPRSFSAPEPAHAEQFTADEPETGMAQPAARFQAAATLPRTAAPPPGTAVPVPVSADSDEHARAKRFAKLLVEEIQLYNQAKVAEGRARRDLYDRLRSDIEKSRAAYLKRYGGVIRDVDYFTDALIRILAANDRSLLGSSFPG